MRIDPATRDDVAFVAERMRESDLTEFLAVSAAIDRQELALELAKRFGWRPDVLCAWDGDERVAIGALIENRPNVITLLFFATDEFRRVAFGLTRFIRGRLFADYRAAGVHRIECVSAADHDEAHRWIRVLGLSEEARLPGFGRNGEAFVQFAWVAEHVS